MDHILIPLAEGLEEIEAVTPIDVLRRAGLKVVTCSLGKNIEVEGSHGIILKADCRINDLEKEKLTGVVLPGGMPGSKNLKENQQLLELIRNLAEKDGLLAAICAAPIVLEEAGVLTERQATSYPGFAQEMSSCIYREEKIVRDGNIFTGRGPGVALDFSYTLVEYLLDEKTVINLKKQMMVEK